MLNFFGPRRRWKAQINLDLKIIEAEYIKLVYGRM